MGLTLTAGTVWGAQGAAQASSTQGNADVFQRAEQSMVLILVGDGAGRVQCVSTGVIIRADGIVLTSYRPIKSAQEVQVRLRDGEIYDQVDLIGFDERRDVAALHVVASGLASIPGTALGAPVMGDKVHVLNVDGTMEWSSSEGMLGPVRLADEIPGAGHGYRVIEFMASLPAGAIGGALLNSRGQLLGLITGSPNAGGPQFAVPVESVAGLPAQGLRTALGNGKNLIPPATTPNLQAVQDGQSAPITALASARTLRVTSKTTFFTPFMLEKELTDNAEFRALGLNVVNGIRGGELLVNVDRPLFTYDFTYSVSDSYRGIILATGKVSAIDGPHAAAGIATKLVQELEKARALQAVQANGQEAVNAQQ
jgi:hypothetical protein